MSDISTTLTDVDELIPAGAEVTWNRLIRSVSQIGASILPISQTIAILYAKGKLTPEVAKAYVNWVNAADKVLNHLADIIEQSPILRGSIDAVATQGNASSGLASMLNGVARPSDELIALLRGPLPVMGPRALQGLEGVAQNIARYVGPAWKRFMELMSNRGVVVVGATAVAASAAKDVIGTDIDLEEQRATLLQQIQSRLIASGVDPDKALEMALRVLGQTKTGTDTPLLWLAGGAAGLGLLLFWMKRQGVTVIVPNRGEKT